MNFSFTPATRETAKARIGLQGPAGSGKTKSALRIAEGLAQGGQIGVVDTERRSALKYAPVPGKPELGGHVFGHMPMDSHDPRNLVQAVRAAEQAELAVLVVDSWSHFWNGRGGLLEIVENTGAKKSGGTFGAWREANPIEQEMLDAILNFRGHLIVTMRTKGDYVIEGKKVTKVGVKAVQREGAEYELDVVMDMVEGTATVTKTRYEPLDGLTVRHPGEDIGETILEQLGQGVDAVQVILDELTASGLTYERALALHRRADQRGLLTTGTLHPKSGEIIQLGALIKEYGTALKPASAPSSAPAGRQAESPPPSQDMAQSNPPSAHSLSDAQSAAGGVSLVTPPQMRMMHALFNKLGVKNRADRLRATSLIVGSELDSANKLTLNEAKELLDTLNAYAERENGPADFTSMVDALASETAQQADQAA
ncbi:AAA family ATPase [Streptomyces sp. PR69]|uniref:AAA family ATPase n=1 Tax=Streptomyces sp. PR69 TaxID=2984950 RepID=UPI0022649E70|nr:AAA family ATPase [Streptomyces sp. PR69]